MNRVKFGETPLFRDNTERSPFRERVETLRRVPKTVWSWQRESPDYNVDLDGYGNIE